MEILKYPNSILKKASSPVLSIGEDDRNLLEQMTRAMYLNRGVGLAAPQVGVNKQIIVADIGDKALLRLINPVVVKTAGKDEMEEGCLSVPNVYVKIKRPKLIKIRALNESGQLINFEANGLLARVILHEIDHLNGRLIIDYINPLKRFRLLKKSGY